MKRLKNKKNANNVNDRPLNCCVFSLSFRISLHLAYLLLRYDERSRSNTYQICSTDLDTGTWPMSSYCLWYDVFGDAASVFSSNWGNVKCRELVIRGNTAAKTRRCARIEHTLTKRYQNRYSLDHIIIILYVRYDDCWQSKHILTHLILLMCVLFHFNRQVYACLCLCLSLSSRVHMVETFISLLLEYWWCCLYTCWSINPIIHLKFFLLLLFLHFTHK